MKNAVVVIILLILPLLSLTAVDAVDAGEGGNISIYYFYVEECGQCKDVGVIIEELSGEYPLKVNKFDIGHNESGRELFEAFMQAYEVPIRDVPALFIGEKYIIGGDSTKENIETAIRNCTGHMDYMDPLSMVKERQSTEGVEGITLSLVILTGLVDGVNPCTFAVLILLLSYLLSVKTKKRVLIIGLSFTASVFITYLIVGLGIIEFFLFSGVIEIIRGIVIIVAIIAGIINIRDFWQDEATFTIPSFAKETIASLGSNAAIPSAIVLGFFATLVELPCTGGIYLPILTLLSKTPSKAIFYLLIYNLFYVLPLIVIIAITYKGISTEEIEGWRKEKRRYMRLIGGLVMVFIGIGMLIGVI